MATKNTGTGWWEVRSFDAGIVAFGEPGHFEDVKSYLIKGRDESMLVDTGMGVADIKSLVDQHVNGPVFVVNTHAHFDHIGDNWRFERVWIHDAEADWLRRGIDHDHVKKFLDPEGLTRPLPESFDPDTYAMPGMEPERLLLDGDVIDLGDRQWHVLHTQGHSPGGISLFEEESGILICGDLLYEGPLYAHLDGSSIFGYQTSMEKLMELEDSVSVIYPSHNAYPLSSDWIARVKAAVDSIIDGRTADKDENGLLRHTFDRFSIVVRHTWATTG